MKITAIIPARYAASRFPAKLVQNLAGMPVIVRTYQACEQTRLFDQVIVATDSDIIFSLIKKHGGHAVMSKHVHESGSDRIAEVAQNIEADIIVNVQGDEPFVNQTAIAQLIQIFREDQEKEIDLASLMQELHDEKKMNDPNYVKVVVDQNNFAIYFSRSPIPYVREKTASHRHPFYEHIGIYAFRKQALLDFTITPMTPLESIEKIECLRFLETGKKIKMIKTTYMGIEIDTPEDLIIANQFWNKIS